jgi:hypothetical protein
MGRNGEKREGATGYKNPSHENDSVCSFVAGDFSPAHEKNGSALRFNPKFF